MANRPQASRPEWLNGALIDTAIVIGTTLATTLLLLLISGQVSDTTAGNLISRSAPAPIILPSPTPSASLEHPSPSPQSSVVAATPASAETPSIPPDDSSIQAAIERKLQDDPNLSSLDITVTVADGQVTLVGMVSSDGSKEKIEKLVRAVKGVKNVNNQIVVVSNL